MSENASAIGIDSAQPHSRRWAWGPTLGQVFDPRNNALNAWRLALAISVIFWHSWSVTGRTITYKPVEQLIEQVGVDGFFAISGFLITASWLRDPKIRDYSLARGLRIFPGLWVCLLIIAFVYAPISVLIQGGSVGKLLSSWAPIDYVLNNAWLNVYHAGIDGTLRTNPWPGVWNASIWTLDFEIACYIAVAVMGVIGLLKWRWVIPTAFVITYLGTTFFSYPVFSMQTFPQMIFRFAVMFAAGALVHQYRDVIPARWSLVAMCVAIVIASGLISNYRVIGALPLAYAVIVSGALVHNRRLNLRTDLSYGTYIYAYPTQQLLVVLGLGSLNVVLFFGVATIATLPMAALSWFLVEKQAIALKNRLKRKRSPSVGDPELAAADRDVGRDASG